VISNPKSCSIVLSVTLIGLTACGGDGGTSPARLQQPAGYAYVASAAAPNAQALGTVFQYSIDSKGSLTPLSTVSVAAGSNPTAMISDPTGHFIYVLNQGDTTISQYSVGTGGVLSALSPATVSLAGTLMFSASASLSVNPRGGSLYIVTNPDNALAPIETSIAQYAIRSDGTLSPLNPSVINFANTASGALAFDPSGAYAYLASPPPVGETVVPLKGEVFQFSVAANGELTLIASSTVVGSPSSIHVAQSGQTAYVLSPCEDSSCDGLIVEYAVGENGTLTPTGTTTSTPSHVAPISLLTNTSDSAAYLLTNLNGVDTTAAAVYQYTIKSAGVLVPGTPSSVNMSSGAALTQAVLGPNLYALISNNQVVSSAMTGAHIDHYSIGSDGLLTPVSTTSVTAGNPTAMVTVAIP